MSNTIMFVMITSSITPLCHFQNSHIVAQDELFVSRVVISRSHSSHENIFALLVSSRSPNEETGTWPLMYLIYYTDLFVVVNFDALTQGSDFRIERRQVVFLC